MFKVNNKDTRTTLHTLDSFLLISGGREWIKVFSRICLISKAKLGEDPLWNIILLMKFHMQKQALNMISQLTLENLMMRTLSIIDKTVTLRKHSVNLGNIQIFNYIYIFKLLNCK